MQQTEIHQFLSDFFAANNCDILENEPSHLTVQLTVEMDKALMNRPFYWTYLEKTGGIPNPMKVTFITDPVQAPAHVKGEAIHFGSPRLHQLFRTAREQSAYVRLYEQPPAATGTRQIPLHPWLMLTVKISYQCDLKKDRMETYGINLINGVLDDQFSQKTANRNLTPRIPDYCFTVAPIIKPENGVRRLEEHIRAEIAADDHEWADQARMRWQEDLSLLDRFYEDMEEKPETYEIEKQALRDQYEPKVVVHIINGGLLYLTLTDHSA